MGQAAVAFSGGVDSSLLLAAAVEVLGKNVIALQASSVLMPAAELEQGRKFVSQLGTRLKCVDFAPLADNNFSKNFHERCYICKKKMYQCFLNVLSTDVCLMDGTNTDDLNTDRPGLKAIKELEIRMPLVEAGFNKVMVRRLSRELGLSCWNAFSSSCLATRIPFGRKITEKQLALVSQAENFLNGLGFAGCRVKLLDDAALVILVSGDTDRFLSREIISRVRIFFSKLHLPKVFLELSARPGILF